MYYWCVTNSNVLQRLVYGEIVIVKIRSHLLIVDFSCMCTTVETSVTHRSYQLLLRRQQHQCSAKLQQTAPYYEYPFEDVY